jgi:subtilase family serine protease
MKSSKVVGLVSTLLLAGVAACGAPDTSQPTGVKISTTGLGPQGKHAGGAFLDLGSTDPTQTVSVSIVFKTQHTDQLEQFVASTQDPSSRNYHQFLSVAEFAKRFAPPSRDVARVAAYLTSFGIQVGAPLASNLVLKATGTVGAFTQAFAFQMHDYDDNGHHYHRPTGAPHVPNAIGDVMLVVTGFSTQPLFKPHSARAAAAIPQLSPKIVLPKNGTSTNTPGQYTVGDFADHYGVNPLYQAGIDGTGSTIGIATLAGFDPADAYNYWGAIGLSVDPNRITQVHVDNGAPISAAGGSGETALDVEQSGGLAPGANMVVYDAPNTNGGFIDLFYTAAADNRVDSLSVSWGSPEAFYFNSALSGADYTSELVAFHQAFLESAAQGISLFAASGDSGAYDAAGIVPGMTDALTTDVPASDPAITAAGGTTLPYSVNFTATDPGFSVTHEQVWGWGSLQAYLVANVDPGYAGALFPVGGGGGVSSFWAAPDYQREVQGRRVTEANQAFSIGGQTLLTLPSRFAGRNVPDVSANADPMSGYLLYSTPDGGWLAGYGGTSFVAPQLNGVSALIRQRAGTRVGLWNAALYRAASQRRNNSGAVVDVTGADNWFYNGVSGYEPGAGVGVIDASKLANLLTAH